MSRGNYRIVHIMIDHNSEINVKKENFILNVCYFTNTTEGKLHT